MGQTPTIFRARTLETRAILKFEALDIPTYGHSGLTGNVDDVRAHGKESAGESVLRWPRNLYRLVARLSGAK